MKSLNQEELSGKISKSTNLVSLVECGSYGCSLTTLVDICNVPEIDVSVIFNGLITTDNTGVDNLTKSLSMLECGDKSIVDNLISLLLIVRIKEYLYRYSLILINSYSLDSLSIF